MGSEGGLHDPELPLLHRRAIRLGVESLQLGEERLAEVLPGGSGSGRHRGELLLHVQPGSRHGLEELRQRRVEAGQPRVAPAFDPAHDPVGERQLRIVPPLPAPQARGEQEMQRLVPRDAHRVLDRRLLAEREADATRPEARRLTVRQLAGRECHFYDIVRPRRRVHAQRLRQEGRRVGQPLHHGGGDGLRQPPLSRDEADRGLSLVEDDPESAATDLGRGRARRSERGFFESHLERPAEHHRMS